MSRSSRLLVGAMVAVAAAASSSGAVAPGAAPASGRFGELRVCPYEGFDRAAKRCRVDRRRSVLVSNRFACSVSVEVTRPARLRARMLYAGTLQYGFTTRVLGRGRWTWWIATNIAVDRPIPGGPWSCEFAFGSARAGVRFRSGGPTGPVVNLAVCLVDDAVFRGVTICRSDASQRPLPVGKVIVCNGVFNRQQGKRGRISLITRAGVDVARGSVVSFGAPLWIADQRFAPQPPGDYACRYLVGDEVVAELPFSVA